MHGFLNAGADQLIIESEVIFPDGYEARIDLMQFAVLEVRRIGLTRDRYERIDSFDKTWSTI